MSRANDVLSAEELAMVEESTRELAAGGRGVSNAELLRREDAASLRTMAPLLRELGGLRTCVGCGAEFLTEDVVSCRECSCERCGCRLRGGPCEVCGAVQTGSWHDLDASVPVRGGR